MSTIIDANAAASSKSSVVTWIWSFVGLTLLGVIAYFARTGAVSPRIANPEVSGVPRPVEFLHGVDFPTFEMQLGCLVMMVIIVAVCVWVWRRYPGHPYVLMTIAATGIVWQDPIMNWAPYAVYNPQLWHFPEDWPLIRLSPTVEPLVIGYASFYFIVPFFASMWVLRRLQAKRSMDAFVWRHPLLSLGLLLFVIGFVFDAMLEIFSVHAGLYIYSQVIPWGSLFAGTTFQFPFIWESAMVTFVMIPAGILCYRDDTGRTVAEKLAQKFRLFQTRPTLANFLVMFSILNVAYFMYGAGFALIRVSGLATAVACPYPYPEAKVYDPQGYYEREGQPGPYFEGYWNRLTIGQPEGRPMVNPLKEDPGCLPESL